MDKITFYSFIILAMVLTLPILSHMLRRFPKALKWSNYLILAVYLFANLYLTLLKRTPGPEMKIRITPLWSYVRALEDIRIREEVILNIFLYIPFGYLMHHAFPKMKWWAICLCGVALSCTTELAQLLFKLGLCETDDVISNTLGTVLGVVMYRGYMKLARESVKDSEDREKKTDN